MFVGVVSLRFDPSIRVDVSLELLGAFVIMRAPDNDWLGSWPVSEVKRAHTERGRFHLTLKGTKLFFDVEDADKFLQALEAAEEPSQTRGSWRRLTDRVALASTKLGLKKSEPESNEGLEQGTDTTPAEPELEQTSHIGPPIAESNPAQRLQIEIAEYQQDVVEWLEAAMRVWFDFYFRLGPQELRPRLDHAANGLEKAALQLHAVSEELRELDLTEDHYQLVAEFARGVDMWASALDRIAVACRLDQRIRAADGFTKMNEGTAVIEQLMPRLPEVSPTKTLTIALTYLDALEPQSNVARKAIVRAKEPWRRALLSAGWRATR